MKNNIPKAYSGKSIGSIPKPHATQSHGILFSFEILEKTDYFNIDMTCPKWPSELFDLLHDISKLSPKELLSSNYKTYRVHPHENATPPSPFPESISPKDCYQIRLGKSKGGIHGIFADDIFFVLWLDPLHNMYPDERYGGLKKIKPPTTCCMDMETDLLLLQKENEKLLKENTAFEQLFNDACS